MRSRCWLAGSLASCLILANVSGAQALTFDEFDRLQDHQRENFINTVLHHIYYQYKTDVAESAKAACMTRLDQASVESGKPHLYSLIMVDMSAARSATGSTNTVEGVIRALIERECLKS